jgi:iron complex transport system ATP-binding protein
MTALKCTDLRASLGGVDVLHGVNVAFETARWTSVVGPNGAGKSTLLKALAGLLPCTGAVQLLGRSSSAWPRPARARALSWLGQNEAATTDLSVYDLAMLGRLPHQAWLAAPSAEDRAVVEHSLRAMQAWQWRERAVGALSGGERQRVLLARLLAVRASVVLMDEPLANLDPPHQADWLHIVRELVAGGTTVVSVLHETSIALQADNMLIMAAGRATHHASTNARATHRALEAVFDDRVAVVEVQGQWITLPKQK